MLIALLDVAILQAGCLFRLLTHPSGCVHDLHALGGLNHARITRDAVLPVDDQKTLQAFTQKIPTFETSCCASLAGAHPEIIG
ncbi:hypothetical protein SAMN02910291_00379 [Desulfovibrio desulfuricans]|uniref:Uncharacterized protein n=1 Tax=Desulfovibrio desulfuricans TaxID=876 RepID=A0AA94HRG3_DESDE|nr:hypothetical protein SAMN02910291_00379 [Desulfovibrio desulfuricans]SPD36023.1 Hypothetical protein DSVG11_1927 [Desulfovibrio sp. G11]